MSDLTVEPAPTPDSPTVGVRVLRTWSGPWRDHVGLVALALLAAQAVVRGALLANGYFTQDDFLMLTLSHQGLSGHMLFEDYSGHLFPGGFLIAWAQGTVAPLNWTVSVVVVMVLQTATAVMVWLPVRRLVAARWSAVPLYAVFLFCPITLWPTQWWAVAIQFLPVAFFLALAVYAFLCRLQDGARWGWPVSVGATVAALLFQERGLLVPVVLVWIAVAHTPVGPWRRRLVVAARDHLLVWASYAVLGIAYLVVHRALAPITTTPVDTPGDAAQLVGNFLGRNLLTGILGGSWTRRISGDSLVVPSWWAVGACLVALVAAVVWTVRRGGFTSVCGWSLILTYALVDVVLLFGGRAGSGPSYGMIPRYAADAVPAVVIGLAIVVRGVVQRSSARERAGRRTAVPALVVTALYLGSAAVSTTFMAPHQFNSEDRRYVEGIRSGLRIDPRTVLYDGQVPDGVMIYWFGRDARLSNVVGIAPEDPFFDLPSYDLRIADGRGRLHPVGLVGQVSARPTADPDCGYHVSGGWARVPLTAPISSPKAGPGLVMRIGYYSARGGFLDISAGGRFFRVPVRPRLQRVDLVVRGSLDSVDLSYDSPGTVCVTDVTVGFPVPGSS